MSLRRFCIIFLKSRGDHDDGDTVTYSTVKASSSPAGISPDPNNLYSTINYPKK